MPPPADSSRLSDGADRVRLAARRLDARRRTATAGGARSVLVASGLVDVGYVEAQVGRRLAGPEEAADVVLADPDLAPHPLVEVPDLRGYLRDLDALQQPTHPLLDAERLRAAAPLPADDTRGLVAAWLATIDDETVLPTVPAVGTVRLRRLRKVAIAAARAAAAVPERAAAAAHVEPAEPTGQPVVSVLVDATGLGLRLRELVTTLQRQTWTAWELLAVDRGSADDTAEVLAGLAAFEPRLRPLPTDHDPLAASDAALGASSGRYLAFADVDRPWAADHLSRAVHHLERSTVAGLGGTDLVGRAGLVVRREAVLDGGLGLAGVPPLGDAAALDVALRLGVGTGADDGLDVRERSAVLARHLPAPAAERVAGRVSVVLPVRDDDVDAALRWAMSARPRRDTTDVELVAVVVAGSPRTRRVLGTTARLAAHVRVVEVPDDVTTALAADVGLAAATGDRVVLARPRAWLERAGVEALVAALDDPSVDLAQPVVVDAAGGLVLSAGASFAAGPRPAGLLAGHPVAHVVGSRVPAPFGPVVAGRTEALLAVGGLDAALPDGLAETDLGARLGGRTVVVAEALAHVAAAAPDGLLDDDYLAGLAGLARLARTPTPSGTAEAWAAAGFDLVGRTSRPVGDSPVLVPHAVVAPSASRLVVDEAPPRLLWTIDTPVPGSATDPYAGTPLARGLAAALTGLGQRVALDPRDLRGRPTRDLDDVVVVLRGGEPVEPRPGTVSVLWVVSDPHTVTAVEAAAHDLVYAASTPWAAQRSRDWRLPVEPLLMATDPAVFHPAPDDAERGGLLYLGSPRHRFRSDVLPALPADTDVSAPTQGHDDGVRDALDRSSVVLFDHTHHERVGGFLGSRLFDAVASGVPVVTDRVDGTEIFGDMVLTFDQVDMVRLAAAPHEYFAERRDRARIAREVADAHTYQARARTLLDAVLARLHAPGRKHR